MTFFMVLRFFLECLFLALVCYAIYRESDLVRFERKAWRFIKAFFKALYYTTKDQINKIKGETKNV